MIVGVLIFMFPLFQGFAVPLTYTLVSKWAPPRERNRFVGFSLNGESMK